MDMIDRRSLGGALAAVISVLGAGAGAAPAVPERPDVRPLAALVERSTSDCNAATFFLRAEQVYRETESAELQKPHARRLPLPPDRPAAKLVLEGIECRRAEFPYSGDFAIPPTNQEIPMRALYWTTALGLAEQGARLRAAGQAEQARQIFAKITRLGLLLYDEPGITYIQDVISLNVLAKGAEGLGDLALARGEKREADVCAGFLAASHDYLERVGVFLREAVPLTSLTDGVEAERVRQAAALLVLGRNPALELELIQYLGLARPLCPQGETRMLAEQSLRRTMKDDPDPRIRKVAGWALATPPAEAREIIQGYVKHPSPMP